MKIKIIKDIPGYKAGEILETKKDYLNNIDKYSYRYYFLIEEGFAEEIKDDIDIEAIREKYRDDVTTLPNLRILCNLDEAKFFQSYRIVKAVIDQLNGDWKPDHDHLRQIYWHVSEEKFYSIGYSCSLCSLLPLLKNEETAQKVIELCEPELKILFGVK